MTLEAEIELAALVPTPRVNLTRYHGVFAPNHRWCQQVTPARRDRRKSETPNEPAPGRHVSMTWAHRLKRMSKIDDLQMLMDLLRDLPIERANHVWATDITYIPMAKGFMYLVLTAMQKRLILGLCAKRRHDRAPRGWSKRRISRAYFCC